jgi:hypothetical protein
VASGRVMSRPSAPDVRARGEARGVQGALNLALTHYTDPDAEIVGVVDADYLLDASYLRSVIGRFADPRLGFLQTPQDYREWEGDPYLTACYDAYRYFFATSMPSRNHRDSIIFAGTMSLSIPVRRSGDFGVTSEAASGVTLMEALGFEDGTAQEGATRILLRAAAASLLNAERSRQSPVGSGRASSSPASTSRTGSTRKQHWGLRIRLIGRIRFDRPSSVSVRSPPRVTAGRAPASHCHRELRQAVFSG